LQEQQFVNKKTVKEAPTTVKKKVAKKKTVSTKTVTKKKVAAKKTVARKTAAKKAPTKKRAAPAAKKPLISPRERYEMIATMAYYRAEQRDFEPGQEERDWYECEKIINQMLGNK
jgi:hypothetical protein